jgi:hypothetical protein
MRDRKVDLEMLLLNIWIDEISGDYNDLQIYLNNNRERLGISDTGRIHNLILVQYRDSIPPGGVNYNIKMVEGHFDTDPFTEIGRYLLNTEYSYGRRKFKSQVISKCDDVLQSNSDGVPLLWYK